MEFRWMSEAEIKEWYQKELCQAFAPQERKPLPDIFALIADNRYELWGLFDENALLGYAALWKGENIPLVLLDYLGVTQARRNGGLGAEILRRLQAQKRPMVAEAEEEVPGDREVENQLRRRRVAFYQRNGFLPVYRMATCGMAWQALLSGAEDFPLPQVMKWHKELYGSGRTDVQVPLPPGKTPQMPYWMK